MITQKLKLKNQNHRPHRSDQDLQTAVVILRRGGAVAFPTETTYGLGCDPRNRRAVERVFTIKGRDRKKPLLLVAGSWSQVECVARLSPMTRQLARQYWPGPLTLILPARPGANLARGVVVNGEVAIRYSSSPIVRRLTRRFGFPIVATSANLSGQVDSRSVRGVERSGLSVDSIIDGGALPRRKPSTVARMKKDGAIEIIRQGAVILSRAYDPT